MKKNIPFAGTSNQEETSTENTLNEYELRLEKVRAMQQAGIDPWPGCKPINAVATDVAAEFEHRQEQYTYQLAGRIMTLRLHGKTAFAHIQDQSGRLQIYVRQDVLGEEKFQEFTKYIDIGDYIWVTGTSFKTKTGEITLKVTQLQLLSKCLHPLPEKFHGLTDIETIYRQRYLDLMTNPATVQRFKKRSTILRIMRNFFDSHGFIEVETPMLHPIPGGAAARPFVTHHNALSSDFYLRIAPELYLKRLVIGGFERVYEINRNFRNEGISTRHNPEFTMVEFYTAHQDYVFAMDFVEAMLKRIVFEVCGSFTIPFADYQLDFEAPFKRITVKDAVLEYGNLTEADISLERIDATLKAHHIALANANGSLGEKIYALFEKLVESQLVQPTFVTQFPIEVSPLAKRDEHHRHVAARFELFIAGMEIANSFNELNDPFDQAERFHEQAKARQSGDAEAHHYDADYIQALEYGLPPTVGVGIGIDRLVMLVTNVSSIKEVILFPTLKKK